MGGAILNVNRNSNVACIWHDVNRNTNISLPACHTIRHVAPPALLKKKGFTATHFGVLVHLFRKNTLYMECSGNRSRVLELAPLKCKQYVYVYAP